MAVCINKIGVGEVCHHQALVDKSQELRKQQYLNITISMLELGSSIRCLGHRLTSVILFSIDCKIYGVAAHGWGVENTKELMRLYLSQAHKRPPTREANSRTF